MKTRELRALLALAVTLGILAGCNTVAGAGQDVEATGDAISQASEEVEEELDEGR